MLVLSRRTQWLRLVLTALLCLAGVARPAPARWEAAGTRGQAEPMHLTTAAGRGEVVRVGKRSDESTGDVVGVVEAFERLIALDTSIVELRAPGVIRPPRSPWHRARARGPPTA